MKINHKKQRVTDCTPTIIDLFCGVGGISLGAARAGFSLLGAVDNDPRLSKTHSFNFPNCKYLHGDISTTTGKDLIDSFLLKNIAIDGIVGGPPCQGFSSIGRNDSKDPRNSLFVHFFRLINECKPKFFLAENVPGILNGKNIDILNSAYDYIVNDYTILPPLELSASDFGTPTSRTRIFFFGYRQRYINDIDIADFSPSKNTNKVTVKNALKGLPIKIKPYWQKDEQGWRKVGNITNGSFGWRLHGHIPKGIGNSYAIKKLNEERRVSGCLGTFHSPEIAKRYSKVQPGKSDSISKSRRLTSDGYCPTLRAGTDSDHGSFQAVRPLHPTENRVITPREAARLQGFPDWFQFDSTKWHSFRQIGNSVSPILAEKLFLTIKKFIKGSNGKCQLKK